ncbi:MAG: hypothetical protein ACHQM6_10985 [Candidatus Kapaibacterium sp.]
MKKIVLIFLAVLILPGIALGKDVLHGYVKDKKTQEPIAGATIDGLSSDKISIRRQMTKVSGEFRIMKDSIAFLHISALGFRDTIIPVINGNSPVILLDEKPVLGEEIIVTAQKHTTAVQDVPISTSVLKSAEITSRAPESVDYALRYIP